MVSPSSSESDSSSKGKTAPVLGGKSVTPKGSLDYESLYEGLMHYIPQGVTIAEAPDVRILAVSRHGQKLSGKIETDLILQPTEDHPFQCEVYHLDGATHATPGELPLTRAISKGEVVQNEEWLIRRPDGSMRRVLCNAGPIRNANGKIQWGVVAWQDVTKFHEARNALAEERRVALLHKDTLLQEANHRVKNNLATISSILRLQSQTTENAAVKTQLNAAAQRVGVLAHLYDQLAHAETQETDARSYFDKLARAVQAAVEEPGKAISIDIDAPSTPLPSALAADLGFVTNELLTNACRHGRSAEGSATVRLRFAVDRQLAHLSVEDKGPGLPPGFSLETTHSLGLKLARTIVKSRGGEIMCFNDHGTRIELHIPIGSQ